MNRSLSKVVWLPSLLAAAGCAILLHTVPDRAHAAWLVPVAVLWGVFAVWGSLRAPLASPVWICLAAGLVRLTLIGTPLHLSDDMYRYLWEGLATSAGYDVFAVPPASIDGLNDVLRAKVNHPEVPSVYPPLALLWFRLLAGFGAPIAVQLLTALVDVGVVGLLRLASPADRAWPAWVYALHPLPVLESANGGHIDVPAVALTVLAIALWRRHQPTAGLIAAGAGAAVKLFPLVLLPTLVRGLGPWRGLVAAVVGGGVLLGVGLPLFLSAGQPDGGLASYAGHWSFNGLVYPWAEPMLGVLARPAIAAVAGVAVLVVMVRTRDPANAWHALATVFLFASPTVHPWYALWALAPSLLCGSLGWSLASIPLLCSYTVLFAYDPQSGSWSEAPWLWWICWPPALLLLGYRWRSEAQATAAYPPAKRSKNGNEAK